MIRIRMYYTVQVGLYYNVYNIILRHTHKNRAYIA